MSYDMGLYDPITKDLLEFDTKHQMRGGTYAVGGTTSASLNITYNYSRYFYAVLGKKGIRTIYGITGAESISILEEATNKLGDDASSDYWASTEGNAKRALLQLIALAKMRPDGVWDGD